MRGQLSTTFGWCTTGLAWCATNVTTTHQPHQTPSAATAGRTVNPQGREIPTTRPHQNNCQQETGRINPPNQESEQKGPGELGSPWAAQLGTPHPLAQPWRRTRWRRCHLPTHNVLSPVFPHVLNRRLPTTPESHKMSASSVGLYKLKIGS